MSIHKKSFTISGIVLKWRNFSETDRILTILTKEMGKISCIAKGVRKINSKSRAILESGNFVKVFFIRTKGMPILTQSKLINACSLARSDLGKIRRLTQFLEILDKLFVEEELDSILFDQIISIRSLILKEKCSAKELKNNLSDLIIKLGFQDPRLTKYNSILDYVSSISQLPMKSFEYLKV